MISMGCVVVHVNMAELLGFEALLKKKCCVYMGSIGRGPSFVNGIQSVYVLVSRFGAPKRANGKPLRL